MPQALPLLAYAAFNAGAGVGVANAILGIGTIGAITHAVIGTGITIGISLALSRWLNPQARQKISDQQIEIREPLPPLRVIYGRLKLGCAVAAAFRTSGSGPSLFRVEVAAGHEIDAFEKHYLNDHEATLDGGFNVIEGYAVHDGNHYIKIIPHLGTSTQTVDAIMSAEVAQWTSEHRGRGIAYVVLREEQPNDQNNFVKVFPNGPYQYQALIRGKKVYDPTKDSTNGGTGTHRMNDPATWEWTEEQRLVMLDFLANGPGYNKGFSRMDWPSWREQILLGRQLVPLRGAVSDGSLQELRYRIAMAWYPATDTKTDILNRIMLAGDARIFFTQDGLIGCRGGEWVAPTVAINVDDAGLEAEFGRLDRMDMYNILHAKYLSIENGYVEQEMSPWREEARITDEGVERSQEIDLTHVPSHSQARRLCKTYIRRDNPDWAGSIKTKLHGIEAIGEDTLDITFGSFDGGSNDFNGPFRVDGEISLDVGEETVSIPLKSADPTAYDWDAEVEEDVPPIVPGAITDDADAALADDANQALVDETY